MDNLANKEFNPLKLENQLCFTIYAASRLMTRQYQPYLDQLGNYLSSVFGVFGFMGERRDWC